MIPSKAWQSICIKMKYGSIEWNNGNLNNIRSCISEMYSWATHTIVAILSFTNF